MKTNSALLVAAISFAAISVQAQELKIPKLPTAASQAAAPQAPAPATVQSKTPVNMADYGVEDAEPAPVRKPMAAVGTDEPASKPSLVQVDGGGRGNDLPAVPSNVAAVAEDENLAEPIVSSFQEVLVTPGVNTIIPASVGHLNRIVTPFEKPVVQTVSKAETFVRENIIYVSAQDEAPITMYITPSDDESVAISLTLAPRKVPPIQARLVLSNPMGGAPSAAGAAGGTGFGAAYSGQAKKWEEGQPYMDSIRGIMRSFALGKLPKGYSMSKLTHMDSIPSCYQEGLNFDFTKAQQALGHNFRAVIAVAQNVTSRPILFDETSCTHPTLAATAVWPNNMLEPGMKTEVYVITRVGEPVSAESTRPSLLN